MEDCLISFEDNTCPICGKGKIVSKNKNIFNDKHIGSDGYECSLCNATFCTEWITSDKGVIPHPLYTPSRITKLKDYFSQGGKYYVFNNQNNDRNSLNH